MLGYSVIFFVTPALILSQLPFGQNSQTEARKLSMYSKPAVVRILAGCTGTYFYKLEGASSEDEYPFTFASIGSGYFVDSDGYIITNAHVVAPSENGENGCKQRLFENLVRKLTGESDLSNVSSTRKDNIEQRSTLKDFVYVHDVVLPNGESLKFDIKELGTPFGGGGKDAAVIKIEVTNAPILKLAGTSDAPQNTDPVVVIGYPNKADVSSALSTKSILEASVLQGEVANTGKTLQDNAPVLQINATVSGGSSGSPVLNEKGEVIGMITFGGSDIDEETSFPFAIPTSTIMEYIRQSGASNEINSTGLLYREGLELFWRKDWEGAKAKFEAVQSLFPQHSETPQLIKTSQQKIAENFSGNRYRFWLILAGASAILLSAAYLLGRRRPSVTALENGEVWHPESSASSELEPETSSGNWRESMPQTISNVFRPATVISSQVYLELRNQEGKVQRFYLQKGRHQLGRDPHWADLQVPDQGWEVISKCHATLEKDGSDYRVYDGDRSNGSTNKTRINGAEITKEQGHLLKDGDHLTIGDDPRSQVVLIYFNPSNSRATRSSFSSNRDA